MAESGVLLRFALGLAAVAGVYLAVRRSRDWSGKPPLLAELIDSRLHYAAAGLILSQTVPQGMRTTLGEGVDLGSVLLAGLFGLIVGCSFDAHLLKRLSRPQIWLEASYLVLWAVGLWLLTHGFLKAVSEQTDSLGGGMLLALCGLGAASWMRHTRPDSGKGEGRIAGWFPSVSALMGLVLAGLGHMQLRPGGFQVRQPLSFPQVIVVESPGEEALWCVLLGAMIGLLVDLATREVGGEYLYYMVAAGLLLGCGVAQVLGLEPLWVGAVAGIWLINATLRRLDLLRALQQGQGMLKAALPGVVGWVLGMAVARGDFDLVVFGWVLSVLVLGIPAARLGAWQAVGRLMGRSALRRTGIDSRQLLELDDLSLVVALGLASTLPAEQAAALLAAALLGQQLLWIIGRLVGSRLAQFTPGQTGQRSA